MIKTENKNFIFDKPRRITTRHAIKFILAKLENVYYRIMLVLQHPKVKEKKYNVSVCAIFKNEARYLREWIEYYFIIGVDHIYLYNNNSSDDYIEILTPYIEKDVVTLTEWPYNNSQLGAYIDCINRNKEETKWLGFFDIDEFVVPNQHHHVYDFLRRFWNRPTVKLYWRVFGTSGWVNRNEEGLVIEDFIACWDKYDEVGKCFYNTAYGFDPNNKKNRIFHHGMWGNLKGITLPPVNCDDIICNREFEKVKATKLSIQINHYFTKSYREYIKKTTRGKASEGNPPPYDLAYFYRHEQLCTSADYQIYKYMIKLKLAMHKEQSTLGGASIVQLL